MTPGPFARFPLVARPRPICGALRDRVAGLTARAKAATTSGSLTEASAVYNLAALIASDCGLPELARQWCLDHANAYLRAPHQGAQVGRNILEPVVNLARLHIRANDGESAYQLLTNLFQAVTEKADFEVEGLVIPAGVIRDDEHQAVRHWLWTVLFSDGTRALTNAGRWTEAHQQLHAYNGVGALMLDGRQVAVIAHAQAGDLETAQHLIVTTEPGEQPWLDAVTACLAVLCQNDPSSDLITDMVRRYERLSVPPDVAVFGVRLGLTILDAAGGGHQAVTSSLAARLVDQTLTARDGYATRDLLAHPDVAALLDEKQRVAFDAIGEASSLNAKDIPAHLRDEIGAALAESRTVLARHT